MAKLRLLGSIFWAISVMPWATCAVADEELHAIGNREIVIAPPEGWCRLDPDRLSDARVIGATMEGMRQAGITLIGTYADCNKLELWRTGRKRTLDNWGIVVYENAYRDFVYVRRISSFLTEVREMMENVGIEGASDLANRAREIVNEITSAIELGTMTPFGIIGEDDTAIYQGFLMPGITEFGDLRTVAHSSATMLLNRKIVYTYLYEDYEHDRGFVYLLEDHKKWASRLQELNN